MKKVLYKSQVTRQELTRSHTITFQEQVGSSETAPEHSGGKILPRAFDTPKETVGSNRVDALHLEFKVGSNGVDASHLKNLQKIPDIIKGIEVVVKKG